MFKKWLVGIVAVATVGFGGMSAVHADSVNCGDFDSGEAVYEFWESNGYHAGNDPEDLDRDSDGLPCEELTSGIAGQFESYEANLNAAEDDNESSDDGAVEEDAAEEATDSDENTEEEGDALPVTSTSYPTMMFFGLAISAFGAMALFLFRRRSVQV